MVWIWVLPSCSWFVTEDMVARAKDRDGDGHAAWQVLGTDCDDSDPAVNPSEREVCDDGKDNDCDGVVDDRGEQAVDWFRDDDHDGYGVSGDSRRMCSTFAGAKGWARNTDDCDDNDPDVNPGASDLNCNGIDDNCDGTPDSGNLAFDEDGDGFGVHPDLGSCADCNDADPVVYPGAPELCDQRDNDCDEEIDESAVPTIGDTAFSSLDDAMQGVLAGSEPAIVELCPGAYDTPTQRIHEKADITVQGWPDSGPTPGPVVIREPDGGSAFLLVGGVLRLRKVQVAQSRFQAAINLSGMGHLEVEDCVVSDSQRAVEVRASDQGGATVSITGSSLTGNDAGGGPGGAIYADGAYELTVTGGEIRENQAHQGGGVYLTGNRGTATLTGVDILENTAALGGGIAGVVFGDAETHGVIQAEGVRIRRNTATVEGGGVYLQQFDLVGAVGAEVDIDGNASSGAGGGVSALRSAMSWLDIHDNTATGAAGGVFYRSAAGAPSSASRLERATVRANSGALGCAMVVAAPADPLPVEQSVIRDHACGAPAVWVASGSLQSVDTDWQANSPRHLDGAACGGCPDVPSGVQSFTFP